MKDVLITYDYYAYGSVMPGRNGNSGDYRYGFNGYENDNEVSGNGNHLDFADYGYSPRLAKRWNVDPKTKSYPHQSPYVFAANSPIQMVDVEGEHDDYFMLVVDKSSGKAAMQKITVENSDFSHRTHFQIHVKDKDGSVKSYDVGRETFSKISNNLISTGNLKGMKNKVIPESGFKNYGVPVWTDNPKGTGELMGEGDLLPGGQSYDNNIAGVSSTGKGSNYFDFISFVIDGAKLSLDIVGMIIDEVMSDDEPSSTPSTPSNSTDKNSVNLPNNGQIDGGKGLITPVFNKNDSCKTCNQKGAQLDADYGNPGLHDIVPVENPQ